MRSRIQAVACALFLSAFSVSAATFTVTSTNDLGAGTLRDAITAANGTVGADTINFNIAGAGPHTIALASALPDIIAPVTIDGASQPGFAGTPLIEVNGSAIVPIADGFHLGGASDGSIIQNLVINGFKNGAISGDNTDNHQFYGNWIGLDTDGTTIVANGGGIVFLASHNNTIGGTGANQRNVIAGNGNGGNINGNDFDGTVIRGNYIGTDVTGLLDRCSSIGITVFFADNVTIGGAGAGEGNVVAGCNSGISIFGNSTGTQITGNLLGVGSDGTTALGNSTENIYVGAAPGGITAISNNVIANAINVPGNGVSVASGATRVSISQNSFRNNFGLAIDLGSNGLTANDLDDPDTGENLLQNYPVITSADEAAGSVTIAGTFNSTPSTSFMLEFYSNTVCDPTGFGEGETFIGSQGVATNAAGDTTFNTVLPGPSTGFITAIARDPNGNTSEFSACVAIESGAVTGTVQLTNTTYSVNESSAFGSFSISRTGGTEPASVQYTITDGTATNGGVDFNEQAIGTVTWAAGDTATKVISFNVINDALPEATETFTVTLSEPNNVALGSPTTATVSIIDNDSPGTFAFSSSTYTGSEAAGLVTITVTRNGGASGPVSVNYATAIGSADATDLTATSGTLNWADGDSAPKTFDVTIADDAFVDPGESFTVSLNTPVGGSIGAPSSATVTITDNDSAGSFAFSSPTYNTDETTGTVLITVNRTGGSIGPASVNYTTAPGTADAGDFTPTSGTLNWANGDSAPKTFSVTITNDGMAEPAQSFTVSLNTPVGGTLGSPTTATVTIAASDAAVAAAAIPTASSTMLLLMGVALAVASVLMLRK